jgi:hypothetical protein
MFAELEHRQQGKVIEIVCPRFYKAFLFHRIRTFGFKHPLSSSFKHFVSKFFIRLIVDC